MDTPFIYDRYVTGKYFIGRKDDCTVLANLISAGEQIALYSAPKAGKSSLIQQALFNMRTQGKQFIIAEACLLNVRTIESLVLEIGSAIMRAFAGSPDEYRQIASTYLTDSHLVFDMARYRDHDEVLSASWEIDMDDVRQVMSMPFRIASDRGTRFIFVIDEFQNIMETEDWEAVLKTMENVFRENAGAKICSMIMCGSFLNAMKEIFEVRKFFYRQVERAPMRPIEEKYIIEHVTRGFLAGGKVVERELILGVCRLFRNNLWYINHFASICDHLSRGFIAESTLNEALAILISIHEPRFKAIMRDLTTFQTNFLDAILDGHSKFSSAEVISKYGLNSSANAKRLREALIKKEVISFGENDEPYLTDPLFEFWVRKYYYRKKL